MPHVRTVEVCTLGKDGTVEVCTLMKDGQTGDKRSITGVMR